MRGDAGVFGRALPGVLPSRLLLREGVGGTKSGPGLEVRRVRDSEDSGALYFLEDARREGGVERGRREAEEAGRAVRLSAYWEVLGEVGELQVLQIVREVVEVQEVTMALLELEVRAEEVHD